MQKKEWLILAACIVVALLLRFWRISDNMIYFWYDQARDAEVAQAIYQDRDIKIQGPSASGTDDTVYHGVLYYYVLVPFYFFGQGDPHTAALQVAVLSTVGLIPFYLLVRQVTGRVVLASIATVLLAVCFEHVEHSSWLSNPVLTLPALPVFLYGVWRIFYDTSRLKRPAWWCIATGVALGILQQATIANIYFWAVIGVGLLYRAAKNKQVRISREDMQQVMYMAAAYIVMISSMLFAQLQLWRAGVFTLSSVTESVDRATSSLADVTVLLAILQMYVTKLLVVLGPYNVPFAVLSILGIALVLYKLKRSVTVFVASSVLAPFLLLLIQFRNSPHTVIGMEYVIILIVTLVLGYLFSQKNIYMKTVVVVWIVGYIGLHTLAIQRVRAEEVSSFTYQHGTSLQRQLELIDLTYAEAEYQPFSVAFWVSPYEYYVSWTYLYDWYGKKKYGYVPTYFGSSQENRPGAQYMNKSDVVQDVHFIIEEPVITPEYIKAEFYAVQNTASTAEMFSTDVEAVEPRRTAAQVGGYTLLKRRSTQE